MHCSNSQFSLEQFPAASVSSQIHALDLKLTVTSLPGSESRVGGEVWVGVWGCAKLEVNVCIYIYVCVFVVKTVCLVLVVFRRQYQ